MYIIYMYYIIYIHLNLSGIKYRYRHAVGCRSLCITNNFLTSKLKYCFEKTTATLRSSTECLLLPLVQCHLFVYCMLL